MRAAIGLLLEWIHESNFHCKVYQSRCQHSSLWDFAVSRLGGRGDNLITIVIMQAYLNTVEKVNFVNSDCFFSPFRLPLELAIVIMQAYLNTSEKINFVNSDCFFSPFRLPLELVFLIGFHVTQSHKHAYHQMQP